MISEHDLREMHVVRLAIEDRYEQGWRLIAVQAHDPGPIIVDDRELAACEERLRMRLMPHGLSQRQESRAGRWP